MKDVVLLNLKISMWGIRRTLGDVQYEVDADKRMVKASKKILECPEYEFLLTQKRLIHKQVKALCLPGSILRSGVYPISLEMVESVDRSLDEFAIRWGVGVSQLGEVWDIRIKEIEERLRGIYDLRDYGDWLGVKECFTVSWRYFTMDTPESLKAMDTKLFLREKAKAAEEWKCMLDEIKDGLRFTFKELVDNLVDRLTPAPDGSKKKLVGVDKLLEFLDMFAKKDVSQDTDIQPLVREVQLLLQGADINEIRQDKDTREFVKERMEEVKSVLDTLVTEAPRRKIELRD